MKINVLFFTFLLAWSAQAGKLVVNNDEWPLSNTGYAAAGAGPASTYALNVANYFTGGGPGNFLVYSSNFGLTQSSLAATMTGAGHTWTINSSLTFTAANLAGYDGVFLALGAGGFNTAEAIAYMNGGGNIYIAAGTGIGGAAAEAAFWNPLLNTFGLALASPYNGIGGNVPISSAHPVLAGVTQLYQDNGSSVSLFGAVPGASIILSSATSGQGLIGVYDNEIPEPGTYALMISGIALLALRRRLG